MRGREREGGRDWDAVGGEYFVRVDSKAPRPGFFGEVFDGEMPPLSSSAPLALSSTQRDKKGVSFSFGWCYPQAIIWNLAWIRIAVDNIRNFPSVCVSSRDVHESLLALSGRCCAVSGVLIVDFTHVHERFSIPKSKPDFLPCWVALFTPSIAGYRMGPVVEVYGDTEQRSLLPCV